MFKPWYKQLINVSNIGVKNSLCVLWQGIAAMGVNIIGLAIVSSIGVSKICPIAPWVLSQWELLL